MRFVVLLVGFVGVLMTAFMALTLFFVGDFATYALSFSRSASITDASNAAPIVIKSANHNLATGTRVSIKNVGGNTSANGIFTITVADGNTFSLDKSKGNGAYTSGGTWSEHDFVFKVVDFFADHPGAVTYEDTGIFLLLAALYGLLGTILAFLRCGWQGALMMLVPVLFTGLLNPFSLLFTSVQAFAALLSFFVFPLPLQQTSGDDDEEKEEKPKPKPKPKPKRKSDDDDD